MAAIIIGALGVLACFVGLDLWWRADKNLRFERSHRWQLEGQLKREKSDHAETRARLAFMPRIPPVLNDYDAAGGSGYLVVWLALTTPGLDVLCASSDGLASETQMDRVLKLIDRRHLAKGNSAVTRKPGLIRLANGSRISFRHANGTDDGRPFMGLFPQLTWWFGPGPMPVDLRVFVAAGR